MKKRILSALLVFVMIFTLIPTAFAATYQVVTVDKTSVKAGETVNVKVTMPEGIETAGSFTISLKFDKDKFKVTKFTATTLMATDEEAEEDAYITPVKGTKDTANNDGALKVNAAYTYNTMQVAGKTVINATLEAKTDVSGDAAFSFEIFEITKSENGTQYIVKMDQLETPPTVTISGGVTPPAHTCSAETLTEVPAKEHTCTEDGNFKYYKCTTCGELYEDADAKVPTTADKVIDKAAHTNVQRYDAMTPTCERDGCILHWICLGCDQRFFDNNGAPGAEAKLEDVILSATGHSWTIVTKGEDNAKTHVVECSVCHKTKDEEHSGSDIKKDTWSYDNEYHWHEFACGTRMDLAEHTWDEGKVTTPATCTEAGVKTFTCKVCQTTKTEPIKATDHSYETTWTTDGTSHWHKCANCDAITGKADHTFNTNNCAENRTCTECGYVKPAGEHSWDAGKVTKEATCTETGEKLYTCATCGETKTETIPMTDHQYQQSKWENNETNHWQECSVCHAKRNETAHDWSISETSATCTKDGVKTYTCKVCGYTKTETLKATGHSMTLTAAKAATCTENGNNAYYTCGNCGKFFSDVDGKTEIKQDSWVIEALGHEFTGDWVSDASGHARKCTRCDATDTVVKHTFNGKPCTEEDSCKDCGYVKPAGQHTWGDKTYTWSAIFKCTATTACTSCNQGLQEIVDGVKTTVPATCVADGKDTYTATFNDPAFTTQTKEVTISALGHTYGEPVWSWGEDGKTATATFTCTREGCTAETTGHAQTVTATVSGKQTVAPTCTDKGTTTYTATVTFESKPYTATKDVQDINALGHKLTKTAEKAATCTAAGNSEYYTCGTCGKFFSDKDGKNEIAKDSWVIAALGHTMTKTEAVTPTCAAEGNNAYYTCGTCHKVFKDEQGTTLTTVAAEKLAKDPANHTGETELRGAVEASCMTAGRTADTYCKGCGKLTVPGTIIQPTGVHNYVNGVCTTCGNKQPANNDNIKADIDDIVADVVDAVKALEDEVKQATDTAKKILEKLLGYVNSNSRSKLQGVYGVTMNVNGSDLAADKALDDAQNVTIAISEETYNALKSGAKIVESYLDKDGNAQTREINATLNKTTDGGYTVTFASDKTAAYGLMTKTTSGGGSSSGGSYTSGKTFTTDLPAGSITSVSVNGKKLDSKYYVISGSDVTLTEAYLATLKAGKYTVRIENKTHVSTGTFTITADGTLSSPRTADAGIALYAMLAVSSLMGTAVVSKKRRKA